MNNRKLNIIFISALLICLWCGAASATTIIDDKTLVLKGNSWNNGTHGWVDVIPGADSVFDLYSMEIGFSNGNLNLSIFTNYPGVEYTVPGSSLTTYPGDLFIDMGLTGTFDYGVALSDHQFDTDLIETFPGNLYKDLSYKTSSDYFEGHSVRNYYGEAWDNPWDSNQVYKPVPVTIETGTLVGNSTDTNGFSWQKLSGSNPSYEVFLSIDLNDLGIEQSVDYNIGLFLSSATCGNDIMAGDVHHPAPEPATMLLLGFGLIGLGGFSRKYLKK